MSLNEPHVVISKRQSEVSYLFCSCEEKEKKVEDLLRTREGSQAKKQFKIIFPSMVWYWYSAVLPTSSKLDTHNTASSLPVSM